MFHALILKCVLKKKKKKKTERVNYSRIYHWRKYSEII